MPLRISPTRRSGFSLVELLVVMGIIVLMAALVIPAMNTIKGGSDLTKSASDLSDLIQQARAYAMGNNTYVYLGIKEVDQMAGGYTDGKGQVISAIVASKTGLRPSTLSPLAPADIQAISRLQRFDNTHIDDGTPDNSGNMARPTPSATLSGQNQNNLPISFTWPLGGSGSTTTFSKVIEFDPQGVARFQQGSNTNNIQNWIEIPLQPSKGSAGVAANEKNAAVLQVDGITGNVRTFRP
jgi:prepilin-type N-terminal cleavage/methylation domain-containing protein